MAEPDDHSTRPGGISERYFAAWEARDPDAIVALHTEDTRSGPTSAASPSRAREAVRAAFAEIFERFPEFGFETYRVLYGDGLLGARLGADLHSRRARMSTARFDCLDVVNVSPDGLVARKDTFIDMVQLQAALPDLTSRPSSRRSCGGDRMSADRDRTQAAA